MTRIRLALAGVLALALMSCSASTASAASLFVNGATGSDANLCVTATAPCKTIAAAVKRSEAAAGAASIEVAAGVYQEELQFSNPADNGIAIVGAGSGAGGTVIEGKSGANAPTVNFNEPGNTASMAHLSVITPSGDEQTGMEVNAELTLTDVNMEMQAASGHIGLNVGGEGSVLYDGGAVTMASATQGTAISNQRRPLTLQNVTVTIANGAKGAAIEDGFAPMSLQNVTVQAGNAANSPAITAGGAGISLSGVNVTVNNPSQPGVVLLLSEGAVTNGLRVTMANATSEAPAVEQQFGTATLGSVDVGGSWKGVAYLDQDGAATLRDSRLVSTHEGPTLQYVSTSENPGLLIQRSVIQGATDALPGVAEIVNGNATFDSSEILGGDSAVYMLQGAGKTRTLTIAGSTVDAGVLGTRDAGARGVEALAEGTASTANVNIAGSIMLEAQRANISAGDTATVACSYSDVPSQSQAAGAGSGTIACANGSAGNTETSSIGALFAAPVGEYQLNPSSSAVDSVPASAISLPFGFTPSSTDLAGNPRVADGNGDCVAVQDRGALELQGHAAACPAPLSPAAPATTLKPLPLVLRPGAITALKLTPAKFYAALSGATLASAALASATPLSATLASAKHKPGTTIGYVDSQTASTRFTVLKSLTGRLRGRSCAKPSANDRKGRRCTLYVALGSFSHADSAGRNSVRFSGRLKGARLAKGSYRLLASPTYAAGAGAPVHTEFTILG